MDRLNVITAICIAGTLLAVAALAVAIAEPLRSHDSNDTDYDDLEENIGKCMEFKGTLRINSASAVILNKWIYQYYTGSGPLPYQYIAYKAEVSGDVLKLCTYIYHSPSMLSESQLKTREVTDVWVTQVDHYLINQTNITLSYTELGVVQTWTYLAGGV